VGASVAFDTSARPDTGTERVTAMSTETDFDDLYGSKYYSVSDLHGEEPLRKIGKVEVAELKEKDGSTKRKYIVWFEGEDKSLVLNKTNAQKLAQTFGKDRTKWVGVTVQLYPEMMTGPNCKLPRKRLIVGSGEKYRRADPYHACCRY